MADVGEVRYKASVDTDDVEKQAKQAGEAVAAAAESGAKSTDKASNSIAKTAENAGKSVQSSTEGVQTSMDKVAAFAQSEFVGKISSAILAAAKSFAGFGLSYNAQLEQYQVALTTALGTEEAAIAAMEQIKADAAVTPFDVSGLTQANMYLISTGESADSARETILALSDAVSATGGGNDELNRMAQNLQQIKNAGSATAADIKQFAYAGIDIYGLLADYTGKTTEEVKEMTVTYDVLNEALIAAAEEGGRYYGANAAQAETLNGRLSTLKDNFSQVAGIMTEALIPVAEIFLDVASNIAGFLTKHQTLATVLGVTFLSLAVIIGTLTGVFSVLTAVSGAFGVSIGAIAAPVAIVIGIVAALIAAGTALALNWDTICTKAAEIWGNITQAVSKALKAMETAVLSAGQFVVDFITALDESISNILNDIMSIATSVWQGIYSTLTEIWNNLKSTASSVWQGIKSAIVSAIIYLPSSVASIASNAVSGIIDAFTSINWSSIGSNIINGIIGGIGSAVAGLVDSAVNAAKSAFEAAKNALGIHSPSTEFAFIGKMSGLGMAEGFDDTVPEVEGAMRSSIQMLVQGVADVSGIPTAENIASSFSFDFAAQQAGTTIEVPVVIDGREIARASAWYMGEQLAWEER